MQCNIRMSPLKEKKMLRVKAPIRTYCFYHCVWTRFFCKKSCFKYSIFATFWYSKICNIYDFLWLSLHEPVVGGKLTKSPFTGVMTDVPFWHLTYVCVCVCVSWQLKLTLNIFASPYVKWYLIKENNNYWTFHNVINKKGIQLKKKVISRNNTAS